LDNTLVFHKEVIEVRKLKYLAQRYATPRNIRFIFALLTLVLLVIPPIIPLGPEAGSGGG